MMSPGFWRELAFIETPFCQTCGIPFASPALAGALCASCLETAPHFDSARSAVVYNDASRKVILDFKYGDRLHAVKTFAPWLQRAGAELIAQSDIFIPVPLHRKRLWQRRFNQSAVIARELSLRTGIKCLSYGLRRMRHTVPQKGLTRKDRHANVKNAFYIDAAAMSDIQGKAVLLIDDVYTTGATLNECARTLKKNGAARVMVLTIARVTRDEF